MTTDTQADVDRIVGDYVAWFSQIIEEPVTGEENFLDAGGNSMIAITLNSKLKDAHGVEIDLRRLFTLPIRDAVRSSANAA